VGHLHEDLARDNLKDRHVNPVALAGVNSTDGALLRREARDGIAVITLNRPATRNSLSLAMLEELIAAFGVVGADPRVRVIVLAGEGPAFCSGHDLKELTAHRADRDGGRGFFEKTWERCGTMMQAILALPQPVIACVEGAAAAAGCQLVASCDLAVASEDATFSTPGVNIGLFCTSPMVPLSRNLTRKHALEMLLTGESVSAADAFRIGLVNRVAPAGRARDAAIGLAERIASRSPAAMAIGKKAFYAQAGMGLTEAYDMAGRIMVENMLNPQAREGIDAFLAKRSPKWDGE
jgi:enoyl-CoA hydratase/carnithine racemase